MKRFNKKRNISASHGGAKPKPGPGSKVVVKPREVDVFLFGESGVGKTTTLMNLIGRGSELKFETSEDTSCTRHTAEYQLTLDKCDKDEYSMVAMNVIDTPGVNDSDGKEQDARNIASIARHIRVNKKEGYQPDIILLTFKAIDNRYKGKNSALAASMQALDLEEMKQLTDGKNLVVVITFFESGKKNIDKMKEYFVDYFDKYSGGNFEVPIVCIDNYMEKEGKTRTKDWTQLSNGTLQFKNLFEAMRDVMHQNGCIEGVVALKAFFTHTPKKSKLIRKEAFKVSATLEEPDEDEVGPPMDALEENIFKQLQAKPNGGGSKLVQKDKAPSPAVVSEDEASQDRDSVQSTPEVFTEMIKSLKENAVATASEDQSAFQNKIRDLMKGGNSPIGKAYLVKTKRSMIKPILDFKLVRSELLQVSPAAKRSTVTSDEIDKSFEMKATSFNPGTVSAKAGLTVRSQFISCSKSYSLQVTKAKIELPDSVTHSWQETNFGKSNYLKELKKLPPTFSEHDKKYEHFFTMFGQGIVLRAFAGGEIIARAESQGDKVSREGHGQISVPFADVNKLFQFMNSDRSFEFSVEDRKLETAKSDRWTISFNGGETKFQNIHQLEQWERSLESHPCLFVFGETAAEDVMFHHDFVLQLHWLGESRYNLAESLKKANQHFNIPDREQVAKKSPKASFFRPWTWTL